MTLKIPFCYLSCSENNFFQQSAQCQLKKINLLKIENYLLIFKKLKCLMRFNFRNICRIVIIFLTERVVLKCVRIHF